VTLAAAFGFLPTDSFNVVVLVAVFVLIAVGLHLTFGLLDVVNLAHGEFLLIGAYTTYQVQESTGSVVVGMLLGPVVAAAVGLAVERGILRFLYRRPLDSLLATFGLAVIIRQVAQLLYSATPRLVDDPIGGSFTVAGLNVPWWRLVVVVITVAVVAAVTALFARTRFGLEALFTIGAGIAGLAGAVLAPLNTLDPQYGLLFLVNSFLVVILGGKGSLRGLVMAATVLGGSLAILQFMISTVVAQIVVLVIAVVGVRLRPVLAGVVAERRQRRAAVS